MCRDNLTEVAVCSPTAIRRSRITVSGIVQGVGFRPFIYRLANRWQLNGFTFNHSKGVTIELQGCPENISKLIHALKTTLPVLARIDNIEQQNIAIESQCSSFEIIESEADDNAQVAVSADKTSCQDCIDEINDPHNRHYQYPFTNCTNCGPRYTLIKSLPYDRKNTAMAEFEMCDSCAKAYHDPLDRRYHAQPVSCPQCGPSITLIHIDGEVLANKNAALQACVELLEQGKILAIKGLGGFHLVCDATNDTAVSHLRQRKQRPAKPFAVMCSDIDMAKSLAEGSAAEWQMLQSPERPIVLLKRRQQQVSSLSAYVAPQIDRLGLFLPYTPLHHLLLGKLKRPLVATSANRSGEPIITEAGEISRQLNPVVDAILDHNRTIINGCDDSVVQLVDDELQVIRLARGYAPLTLPWEQSVKQHTLALGAQQKNSIAFGFGHNLVLSPHIGDLFSIEAEQYFVDTLATFKRLYQFKPLHLVCDKHPEYTSSRWAEQYVKNHPSCRMTKVQHHYAHILSTMAANQFTDKVLGLSFDGTGLGEQQQLWGGEAMVADINGYQRIASLAPFALIGNEQAIIDPRRVMLALLFQRYDIDTLLDLKLPGLQDMPASLINNLHRLWQSGAASHHTSSVGRLFDALACLLGLMQKTQFEGQAGMLIEACANQISEKQYQQSNIHFELPLDNGIWQTQTLWQQIVDHLLQHQQQPQINGLIARAFMDCLARAIANLATQYPSLPVVLSGGVFQNRYLLSQTRKTLALQPNKLLSPKQIPVNDAGIALGQLWFAVHQQN
ncbi:carbamoyltransferase HypF [Shewanella sp. Isolate11]|uniref:carbamoyltransferase HypF n=1 Tax=Shewanella sp. Isolate11 TaxID=2908530 RepID=UPI001EFE1B4A|nr:carbamoyltransferase HypF [Shewanella sp. Isolate11]MCG9696460.1 carbamoyltransferase HypF [Shewanella sp. Isolate11]